MICNGVVTDDKNFKNANSIDDISLDNCSMNLCAFGYSIIIYAGKYGTKVLYDNRYKK